MPWAMGMGQTKIRTDFWVTVTTGVVTLIQNYNDVWYENHHEQPNINTK
jgi:hypothetical protein